MKENYNLRSADLLNKLLLLGTLDQLVENTKEDTRIDAKDMKYETRYLIC